MICLKFYLLLPEMWNEASDLGWWSVHLMSESVSIDWFPSIQIAGIYALSSGKPVMHYVLLPSRLNRAPCLYFPGPWGCHIWSKSQSITPTPKQAYICSLSRGAHYIFTAPSFRIR